MLRRSIVAGIALLAILAPRAEAREAKEIPFSFHLPSEPASLDPARLSSTDASYFFSNLFRGLYVYRTEGGLSPEGAKSCRWLNDLKLQCELDPSAKWSDGSAVAAEDYVRGFRHLVAPSSKNLGVELLRNVRNALAVFSDKAPASALGIKAVDAGKLEVEFTHPDPDFLFKLTSPLLVPIKKDSFPERARAAELIVNGPYKVEKWETGKRVWLAPNSHYAKGFKHRPRVEVLFVDEEETALSLYEQGRLQFLRRLPTTYIPTHKSRPDFVQVPVARFDYVGFGPELKNQPELRKAFSLSLNFAELKRIYHALGIPGCPSLPEEYLEAPIPCLEFDLQAAKNALAKVEPAAKSKRYKLAFSKLGGDDVKKGAEWIQAQWLKHLSIRVDLEQVEQGVFLQRLRTQPPDVFRKGVGLERPTCLSALETFLPGGSENFLKLEFAPYVETVTRLQNAKTAAEKKKFCSEGVKRLLDQSLLIPLGRIHFTLLARPRFQGWNLNEMNQLDLAGLYDRDRHKTPK